MVLYYRQKEFEISNEIFRFKIKYTKTQKLNELGTYKSQGLANYGL
jgi:hypothetical protein